MIAAVHVEGLFELIWVAPLAVMAVSLIWSLCVLAVTRAAEHRRAGNGTVAFGYGVLSAATILAFAGAIALALYVIING